MTIAEWMEEDRVTRTQVAEIAGCSITMVYYVLTRKKRFRPDKLQKIISASGGKVTYEAEYG